MDTSKYLDTFIEEARENIQSLNQLLLELEKDGYSKESMYKAYRLVHTLKGNAKVLGIDLIGEVAHSMEDVLDGLQESGKTPEGEMLDLLFEGSDLVETMIHELIEDGTVKTNGKKTIKALRDLTGDVGGRMEGKKKKKKKKSSRKQFTLNAFQKNQLVKAGEQGLEVNELTVSLDDKIRLKEGRVFQLLRELSALSIVIASIPDAKEVDQDTKKIRILLATKEKEDTLRMVVESISGVEVLKTGLFNTPRKGKAKKADRIKSTSANDSESTTKDLKTVLTKEDTVRVKSKHLDQLLDLVGEIMISDIRATQIASDLKSRELGQVLKNRERLISDLQDIVLRIRMVPVDYIFKRFPRMLRDLSKESGKEVDFKMSGNDMEIDRSLLDDIGDSLVHTLRNAVDHGIESEEERIRAGKKPIGSIILSAYREQRNIVITVKDDGKGLDPEKIMENAISRGKISEEEAKDLDEKQVFALAFRPGVSTASKVTEVSGRGVGLDVVKTKIESLGGSVRLESEMGKFTRLMMKLPPSMSIISAMLVEIDNERYGIPLENVNETTRIPATEIHEFSKSGMFRLRDDILPIINIHEEFGGEIEMTDEEMPVVIVEKDENRAGLIVSKLIGQQEIVVKTIGKELAGQRYFSGATILGDGRVAMILDVGAVI